MPETDEKEKSHLGLNVARKTDGKNNGEGPSEEGAHLWYEYTKDIDPFIPNLSIPNKPPQRAIAHPKIEPPPAAMPIIKKTRATDQDPQLDGRTQTRLKRGQLKLEARLDLHGRTQDEGHSLFNRFIQTAYEEGLRCVLVITGKGKRNNKDEDAFQSSGILRRQLPVWAKMPPFNHIILKTQPAALKDGGGGAYYIYIKRKRE